MTDPDVARGQMLRQQLRTSDILDDRILAVLETLPRHEFVPAQYASLAYADTRIPLDFDQQMMTPLTEGRVLKALALSAGDTVLEIGTGSGYLTACLASLAESVVSLDIYPEFTERAADRLARAQLDNVELHTMDATQELPKDRYDAIAVTGSIAESDERLSALLKPGGRLFVVVGESPLMQALLVNRVNDVKLEQTTLFETEIPALIRENRDSEFSF